MKPAHRFAVLVSVALLTSTCVAYVPHPLAATFLGLLGIATNGLVLVTGEGQ